MRGDDFAGSAPGGEAVEDDDLVVFDGGLEFRLAVEVIALASVSVKIKTRRF